MDSERNISSTILSTITYMDWELNHDSLLQLWYSQKDDLFMNQEEYEATVMVYYMASEGLSKTTKQRLKSLISETRFKSMTWEIWSSNNLKLWYTMKKFSTFSQLAQNTRNEHIRKNIAHSYLQLLIWQVFYMEFNKYEKDLNTSRNS
jgi:hypothetical protein